MSYRKELSVRKLTLSLSLTTVFHLSACNPSDFANVSGQTDPATKTSDGDTPKLEYQLNFIGSSGQCTNVFAKNTMIDGAITVRGENVAGGRFTSFSLKGQECPNALDRQYNPWGSNTVTGSSNGQLAMREAEANPHGCAWLTAPIKHDFMFPCGGQSEWIVDEPARIAQPIYYDDYIQNFGAPPTREQSALSCKATILWVDGKPAKLTLIQVYEALSGLDSYNSAACTHTWQVQ